jgi:hypothetical protein
MQPRGAQAQRSPRDACRDRRSGRNPARQPLYLEFGYHVFFPLKPGRRQAKPIPSISAPVRAPKLPAEPSPPTFRAGH